MFTGIIEATARVKEVKEIGTNRTFWLESALSKHLKPDQSVSHNGVCLTVEEVTGDIHRVTAIQETLLKTTLTQVKAGSLVNLERSMLINGRLDGHFVQGHVDTTAKCLDIKDVAGSLEIIFSFPREFAALVIEKGSIALDGISLTVLRVTGDTFSVAIIPYTLEHTNLKDLDRGTEVNVEFDIIGKYIQRRIQLNL